MSIVYVGPSDIDGMGLFTRERIVKGDLVIGLMTHMALRWINHCRLANLEISQEDGILVLRAISDIAPDEELTLDYRDTLNPFKGMYDFQL